MEDKRYLLTYQDKDGTDFAWFDTEDELWDFVDNNDDVNVMEALKINSAETIG